METIKEETQNRINELSSKLAEHSLLEEYNVSLEMLYYENGYYFPHYQKEFDILFGEFYNELVNLTNDN